MAFDLPGVVGGLFCCLVFRGVSSFKMVLFKLLFPGVPLLFIQNSDGVVCGGPLSVECGVGDVLNALWESPTIDCIYLSGGS